MRTTITHRPSIIFLATFIFSGLSTPVKAQDSSIHEITKEIRLLPTVANKNYLSFRSLAAPTLFIGYGFASLRSEPLINLNNKISEEVQEDMSSFKTKADDYLKFAPTVSVYMLSTLGIKGRHKFIGRTVILAASTILSEQLVTILKHSTHQLRPDGSTYNSFPSGHTTTAFIGAELMNQEFGFRSPWFSIAGYTMATGTALLRIMNNRHWLGDVIAGAGIGMLSTKFCYWVYSKWEKRNRLVKKVAY